LINASCTISSIRNDSTVLATTVGTLSALSLTSGHRGGFTTVETSLALIASSSPHEDYHQIEILALSYRFFSTSACQRRDALTSISVTFIVEHFVQARFILAG